jgi:hypothetical protein
VDGFVEEEAVGAADDPPLSSPVSITACGPESPAESSPPPEQAAVNRSEPAARPVRIIFRALGRCDVGAMTLYLRRKIAGHSQSMGQGTRPGSESGVPLASMSE